MTDLPDLLEHVAAALRDDKRPSNTRKVFAHILTAACEGWLNYDDALQAAAEYAASGYPAGAQAEGHGKGTHSDPTYVAATSPNPFGMAVHRLRSAMFNMDQAAVTIRSQLNLVLTQEQNRGREMVTDECAEAGCHDTAVAGREGRCEADYRWRYRWRKDHPNDGPPPPVPADVIEARRIKRRREAA